MINLHTHVTGRGRTVKHIHLTVLGTGQRRIRLPGTDAQINLGQLAQRSDTGLEVSFLAREHIFEVLTQRHTVECTYEDCLRSILGISHHVIGTLAEESEQTTLQKQRLHVTLHVKLTSLLLTVRLNTNTQKLTSVTAFNQ